MISTQFNSRISHPSYVCMLCVYVQVGMLCERGCWGKHSHASHLTKPGRGRRTWFEHKQTCVRVGCAVQAFPSLDGRPTPARSSLQLSARSHQPCERAFPLHRHFGPTCKYPAPNYQYIEALSTQFTRLYTPYSCASWTMMCTPCLSHRLRANRAHSSRVGHRRIIIYAFCGVKCTLIFLLQPKHLILCDKRTRWSMLNRRPHDRSWRTRRSIADVSDLYYRSIGTLGTDIAWCFLLLQKSYSSTHFFSPP
jgi:hypothetical protein